MPPKTPRTIKATAPRRKRTEQEGLVNIQRKTEERLVDTKIIPRKSSRLPYVVGIAAIAGIGAGAAILYYFYNADTPWQPYERPEIILPEEQEIIDQLDNMGSPSTTPTSTPRTQPPVVTFQEVLILDTPTGFLNVRAGAGTGFAKTGEVSPGEVYDLVSENAANGGWFQIKLSDGTVGWVTKQYAKIQ